MMYHINQKFLDEIDSINVGDLDEWGTRLLNIIEEQEVEPANQEEEQEEA